MNPNDINLGPFSTTYGGGAIAEVMKAQGLFPKNTKLPQDIQMDSLFWANEYWKNPEQVITAVIGQAAINPPDYTRAVGTFIVSSMSPEQITTTLNKLSTPNLIWAQQFLFPEYSEYAHSLYIQRDLSSFLRDSCAVFARLDSDNPETAKGYGETIKSWLKKYAPTGWQKNLTESQSKDLLTTIYKSDVSKLKTTENGTATPAIGIGLIAALAIGGYFLLRSPGKRR